MAEEVKKIAEVWSEKQESVHSTQATDDHHWYNIDDTQKSLTAISTSEDVTQRSSKVTELPREEWQNQFQFLLATIGLAVGLGNIWRFPAVAFENGGSAFLLPYMICAAIFGFPLVYAEFVMGQYCRSGPSMVFYHYAPALQGLGWSAGILSASICIYYTTIIAWTVIYLVLILFGQLSLTASCDNWWNTENCVYPLDQFSCDFNMTCTVPNNSMSAAEEFFTYYVLRRSSGIDDFGGINYPALLAIAFVWLLVGIILIKGVEFMGKLSYVTTTFPYIILVILFIRGVTLDGSLDGIHFYLGAPEWDKVLQMKTWTNAVKQICFSLSVGYGGLITLSSYNKFTNNCFKDALTVILCDTVMSVVGGTAVFSTLGYLAKQLNKPIQEVVQSGTSLAFIAYPQAISTMPFASFFAFLFFLMLFLLGISTEVALLQVLCQCIYDRFKSTRRRKWMVVGSLLSFYFVLSLVMATGAAWYWLNIYDSFTGTTTICIHVIMELIIIAWYYGINNFVKDIDEMFGPANGGILSKLFGSQSLFFKLCWKFISPVLTIIIFFGTIARDRMVDIFQGSRYVYPLWSEVIGWFLSLFPLIALPVFFIINLRRFKKFKRDMFHLQPSLKSFSRIYTVSTQDSTHRYTETTSRH